MAQLGKLWYVYVYIYIYLFIYYVYATDFENTT